MKDADDQAYDSRPDTEAHIAEVQKFLHQIITELIGRAELHDRSKLEPPEKEGFDVFTPLLKSLTYNSPEYLESLAQMGFILAHHYQVNSHHPQHYPNGVDGMDLLDVIEMLADWKAATLRHHDGNLLVSLEQNRQRFNLSDQMYSVLLNTARRLGWIAYERINSKT